MPSGAMWTTLVTPLGGKVRRGAGDGLKRVANHGSSLSLFRHYINVCADRDV